MEDDDESSAEAERRCQRLWALEQLVAMGDRGDFDVLLDGAEYRPAGSRPPSPARRPPRAPETPGVHVRIVAAG